MSEQEQAGSTASEDDAALGTGPIEGEVESLTDEAQNLANAAVDGIQEVANHAFDLGERSTGDVLRVADALVSAASRLQTAVTAGVTGDPQLKTEALAEPGGGKITLTFEHLSEEAQGGANRALDAMQRLANQGVDIGQENVRPWLQLADTLVTRASTLHSSVVGNMSGKIGGSQ